MSAADVEYVQTGVTWAIDCYVNTLKIELTYVKNEMPRLIISSYTIRLLHRQAM